MAASEIAKKVAGTYVADSVLPKTGVLAWLTAECRTGKLHEHVERFCREQEEALDPALVVVEAISGECIQCKIPVKASDHESDHTFLLEVKFRLNPAIGQYLRD